MTVEAPAPPTIAPTGTTALDLMAFLDQTQQKGYMKGNTAQSLKAAAKKVLSIDGDLAHIDVAKVDVEELFRRFANLPAGDALNQESKAAYRQRVSQAVGMFLAYKADPIGWRPPSAARTPRPAPNGKPKHQPGTPAARQMPEPAPPPQAIDSKWRVIDFPFPLREGLIAHLILPADLKRAEVRRLNAYMATLAADGDEGQ